VRKSLDVFTHGALAEPSGLVATAAQILVHSRYVQTTPKMPKKMKLKRGERAGSYYVRKSDG